MWLILVIEAPINYLIKHLMHKVKKVVKIVIKHCSRVWMGPLVDTNRNYHHDLLDTYTSVARLFPLNFEPFVDFKAVLCTGIAAEFEDQVGLHNEDQDVDNAEAIVAQAYETQLYNDWVKAIPCFSDLITKFQMDPDGLNDLIDTMGTAANGGSTDDTGSLKFDGLDYMLKDPTKEKIEPPIPRTQHSTNADRAWNNQTIAHLLCPARNVWEFDLDPQYIV
ncbi:hypothetical protein BDN67DRAFT_984413 [Paxillus ammoniavirescens]|nr:hypothetical protein BDN67DRAFT_984413 [Paxillus ammoniavirescens]